MSRYCDYPASIDFILPALNRGKLDLAYDNSLIRSILSYNPVGGAYNQRFARTSPEAYANVLTMLSLWQNATIGRTYAIPAIEPVEYYGRLHSSPAGSKLLSYADYTIDNLKWENFCGRPLCECDLSAFCGVIGAIEVLSGYNPLYRTNENIGTYEVQYTGGGLIQEQIYVGYLSTYTKTEINVGERYGLFMIPDATAVVPHDKYWGWWINEATGMGNFEYQIFDYPVLVATGDQTKDYDDNVHNKIMIGGLLCKAIRYGTEMPGVSNTINSRCGGSTPGMGLEVARQFIQLFDAVRTYDNYYLTPLAQVNETYGSFDLKPQGVTTDHRPIWDYTVTGHPFQNSLPLVDNATGAPIDYSSPYPDVRKANQKNASIVPWTISRPVEQPEQCAEEFLDSFCNWYYDFSIQEKAQAKAAARYWYDRLGGETQCEYLKRTGARSPSKIIYW